MFVHTIGSALNPVEPLSIVHGLSESTLMLMPISGCCRDPAAFAHLSGFLPPLVPVPIPIP